MTLGLPPACPQLGEESPKFPALSPPTPPPNAEVWGCRAAPALPTDPWVVAVAAHPLTHREVLWSMIRKLSLEALRFLGPLRRLLPPSRSQWPSSSGSVLTAIAPAAAAPGLWREASFTGASDPSPAFLHTDASQESRHTRLPTVLLLLKKNLFITAFEQNLLVLQTDDAHSFHLRFC